MKEDSRFTRREVVHAGTVTALALMLAPAALALSPNPPQGPFGSEATAEQVTDGIDLSGKVAVVTGCNSGLGYETMRVLALRGATVLGTARSSEKAEKACGSIEGDCRPFVMDLGDLDSVRSCAAAIKAETRILDMLICNAGIMALPELQQVNGIEKHFAINHLGHFLFVTQLLEPVKAAPQGRVVILSSLGYRWAPAAGIEFDNLSGEAGEYVPNTAYGQSKLANALFAYELAKRLEGSSATANSVHPGIINTNLGRHMPVWKRTLGTLIGWTFMKSIPEGSATTTYVATAPALAKVNGHYFEDCNPVVPDGPHMRDDALAAKLWEVSLQLTQA